MSHDADMGISINRTPRRIISIEVDKISYQDALRKIISLGKNRVSTYVCFANVHMVIEAYRDKKFAEQVNNASLVLADGMPVVKAFKFFYGEDQDRVAGMDVMPDLIKQAEINDLKVFFFGTTDELLAKIRQRIEKEHPGLQIAGMLSPPFNKSLMMNPI